MPTQVVEIVRPGKAVPKYFPANSTFNLLGQTYTLNQIVSVFQARVDAGTKVATIRPTLKSAIQDDDNEQAETKALFLALVQVILASFGNAVEVLTALGVTPRKPRTPPTVATKAVALAKASATRVARNTRGKKQKLDITGTLTGPVVVAPGPHPVVSVEPPRRPSGNCLRQPPDGSPSFRSRGRWRAPQNAGAF